MTTERSVTLVATSAVEEMEKALVRAEKAEAHIKKLEEQILAVVAQRDHFRRVVGDVCGFVNSTGKLARQCFDELPALANVNSINETTKESPLDKIFGSCPDFPEPCEKCGEALCECSVLCHEQSKLFDHRAIGSGGGDEEGYIHPDVLASQSKEFQDAYAQRARELLSDNDLPSVLAGNDATFERMSIVSALHRWADDESSDYQSLHEIAESIDYGEHLMNDDDRKAGMARRVVAEQHIEHTMVRGQPCATESSLGLDDSDFESPHPTQATVERFPVQHACNIEDGVMENCRGCDELKREHIGYRALMTESCLTKTVVTDESEEQDEVGACCVEKIKFEEWVLATERADAAEADAAALREVLEDCHIHNEYVRVSAVHADRIKKLKYYGRPHDRSVAEHETAVGMALSGAAGRALLVEVRGHRGQACSTKPVTTDSCDCGCASANVTPEEVDALKTRIAELETRSGYSVSSPLIETRPCGPTTSSLFVNGEIIIFAEHTNVLVKLAEKLGKVLGQRPETTRVSIDDTVRIHNGGGVGRVIAGPYWRIQGNQGGPSQYELESKLTIESTK